MYKPTIKLLALGLLLGFAACKKDSSSNNTSNNNNNSGSNNNSTYSFKATLNGAQTTGTPTVASKTTTSGFTMAAFDGKLTYKGTDYQVVMSVTGYNGIASYKDGDSTAVSIVMAPASGSNIANPLYEYAASLDGSTITVTKVDAASVTGTFSSKVYNNGNGVSGSITDSIAITDGTFVLKWQ